jgi:Abnormal spindle-like microcephaly-assoc'd, ASPM-SPD-2-Hydin
LLVGIAAGSAAAAGTLKFSHLSVKFGDVVVGSHSAVSLKITNTGKGSVVFSRELLHAKEFSVLGFSLPRTLSEGEELTFIVKFSPSKKGTTEGSIEFESNATNHLVNLALEGRGVAVSSSPSLSGALSATPEMASFDTVPIATTDTQTIELKNQGKTTVTISSVNVSGAGFKATGLKLPYILSAGETTALEVEFTPTKEAESSGKITVEGNSGHVSATIALSGTGVADTRSLVIPTSLNFGNVTVGQQATMQVVVKNTGNSSVQISGVSVTGPGLSATGISAGLTIGAQTTATLAVALEPKSLGSTSGSITITSNAPNAKNTIAVAGTGVAGAVHEVQLTWGASNSPEVVGYNVYRSNVSGGSYAKIVASPVSGTEYTDTSVQADLEYYYVVTAVNVNGVESNPSNQTAVTIP